MVRSVSLYNVESKLITWRGHLDVLPQTSLFDPKSYMLFLTQSVQVTLGESRTPID